MTDIKRSSNVSPSYCDKGLQDQFCFLLFRLRLASESNFNRNKIPLMPSCECPHHFKNQHRCNKSRVSKYIKGQCLSIYKCDSNSQNKEVFIFSKLENSFRGCINKSKQVKLTIMPRVWWPVCSICFGNPSQWERIWLNF